MAEKCFSPLFLVCLVSSLTIVALTGACTSSKVDPRCSISAPSPGDTADVAKAINGSKLWQAYLEHISPVRDVDDPVIGFNLTFNREITRRSNEGDYDDGVVHAYFSVANLWSGSQLYSNTDRFPIKDFVFTDGAATREEVQAAAFSATEDTAMRYVHNWVQVAAIRAMRQVGTSGSGFISVLEEQMDDPWGDNLIGEAKQALKSIRGN
jgi:hypothetical protein